MNYAKPKLINVVVLLGIVLLALVIIFSVIWWWLQSHMIMSTAGHERINFSSQQYQDLLEKSKVVSQTNQKIELYLAINDLDERVTKIKYHDPNQALKASTHDYTTLQTTNISFIDGPNVFNPRMKCMNDGDQLEKIVLFTTITNQVVFGGGYSRTAYLCGNEYVISQFQDAMGIDWAGPFTLK